MVTGLEIYTKIIILVSIIPAITGITFGIIMASCEEKYENYYERKLYRTSKTITAVFISITFGLQMLWIIPNVAVIFMS